MFAAKELMETQVHFIFIGLFFANYSLIFTLFVSAQELCCQILMSNQLQLCQINWFLLHLVKKNLNSKKDFDVFLMQAKIHIQKAIF